MKTTSCGVLLLNPAHEILLCHATGTPYWDIPKGAGDPGEHELDTALRETAEETSVRLPREALRDLGRFSYRPRKDLHLFAVLVERFDAGRCRCTSRFVDARGRMRLEMDAFRWSAFADVAEHCAPSMARLLSDAAALPRVLAELQAAGTAPVVPQWHAPPPSLEEAGSPSRSPDR
jgi:8-oxo-dGTP pyrophosphatase MutT (NUDIX family)